MGGYLLGNKLPGQYIVVKGNAQAMRHDNTCHPLLHDTGILESYFVNFFVEHIRRERNMCANSVESKVIRVHTRIV